MKNLALALLALASLPSLSQAEHLRDLKGDWRIIHEARYSFPYGVSVSSTFPFSPPVRTTQISIEYYGDYCTSVSDQYIEVRYDDKPGFVHIHKNADGTYPVSGEITHLRIHNVQSQWSKVTCLENIYALDKEKPDPVAHDFEFVGSLTLEGGSKTELSLDIDVPYRVTHLWVETPAYCSDIDIVEAGTITEGYYDEAKLVDENKNIYEISNCVGVRIGAIQVTAKAKKGKTCPLNFYLQKHDDER